MEEELELNLDETVNKAEERIKNLSSKVRDTAKERDEAKAAVEAAEAEKQKLQKEVEFFSSFSEVTSKYQAAPEFKDAIKEKVLAGYTVEDATVSVLNSNGKLMPQAQVQAPQGPVAGGSAATNIPDGTEKSPSEMKADELRSALENAAKEGELSKVFRI